VHARASLLEESWTRCFGMSPRGGIAAPRTFRIAQRRPTMSSCADGGCCPNWTASEFRGRPASYEIGRGDSGPGSNGRKPAYSEAVNRLAVCRCAIVRTSLSVRRLTGPLSPSFICSGRSVSAGSERERRDGKDQLNPCRGTAAFYTLCLESRRSAFGQMRAHCGCPERPTPFAKADVR